MEDASNNSKSLITQILDKTLDELKNHSEFDQDIIDKLKKLVESGDLKKNQLVKQTLAKTTEQK